MAKFKWTETHSLLALEAATVALVIGVIWWNRPRAAKAGPPEPQPWQPNLLTPTPRDPRYGIHYERDGDVVSARIPEKGVHQMPIRSMTFSYDGEMEKIVYWTENPENPYLEIDTQFRIEL
jgi:hypothetical protein